MANALIFLMKFLGMDFFFFFSCSILSLWWEISIWKMMNLWLGNFSCIIIIIIFIFFFIFVIFSVSSTVTMQIDVLLLKQSLPDMFRSSSSYFILISWKFSDLLYSPTTINKHPLVSVMNFHGVWGKRKKEDPHSICLNISRCPICYWRSVEK